MLTAKYARIRNYWYKIFGFPKVNKEELNFIFVHKNKIAAIRSYLNRTTVSVVKAKEIIDNIYDTLKW
jgi:ribosomal protein L7/L12